MNSYYVYIPQDCFRDTDKLVVYHILFTFIESLEQFISSICSKKT